MNLNWRSQRQIIIFSIYFLIIFVPVSYITFSLLRTQVSCFDGIKNGLEEGIDCNGSCDLRCENTYKEVKVDFTRSMKVDDGVYDIFALLDNYNLNVTFPKVPYSLNFYSAEGKLLGGASGTLAILPQSKVAIYLPSLRLAQAPKTVDLTILPHKALLYPNLENIPKDVSVQNWQAQRGANDSLQLVGELKNPYNREVKDIAVYALLYDDTKTVYAVSKTKVTSLKGREKTAVAFTWGNIITPTNADFIVVFGE